MSAQTRAYPPPSPTVLAVLARHARHVADFEAVSPVPLVDAARRAELAGYAAMWAALSPDDDPDPTPSPVALGAPQLQEVAA